MALAVRFGNIFSFTVVLFIFLITALLFLLIIVNILRKIQFARRESKKESQLLKMRENRILKMQENGLHDERKEESKKSAPEGEEGPGTV